MRDCRGRGAVDGEGVTQGDGSSIIPVVDSSWRERRLGHAVRMAARRMVSDPTTWSRRLVRDWRRGRALRKRRPEYVNSR